MSDQHSSQNEDKSHNKSKSKSMIESQGQELDKSKSRDMAESQGQGLDKSKSRDMAESQGQGLDKSKSQEMVEMQGQDLDKSKSRDMAESQRQDLGKSESRDVDGLITRRGFLWGSSTALIALGALTKTGCSSSRMKDSDYAQKSGLAADTNPSSWWHKEGGKDRGGMEGGMEGRAPSRPSMEGGAAPSRPLFIVHDTVDTRRLAEGVILARVDGSWRPFKVVELPDRFVDWSLQARVTRLGRMLKFGGMDPRDLAGSHNACVATYGGPRRDSAVSLNTAYKGMGFAVHSSLLAETTERIKEERIRIEQDTSGDPSGEIQAKVNFLADFYRDASIFDRTRQVSLELFTSPDFQTHTFLNMMVNPIASASFLAFPTFEIRAVPQLLHPQNPGLSKQEKDMVAYTNAIHDFIHSGPGDQMVCVYHVVELFDDTPNDMSKGRRIV